jgi:hypothetical protein
MAGSAVPISFGMYYAGFCDQSVLLVCSTVGKNNFAFFDSFIFFFFFVNKSILPEDGLFNDIYGQLIVIFCCKTQTGFRVLSQKL